MGRARPFVLAIAISSLFAASGGLEACGARTGLRALGQACEPGSSRSCVGKNGCSGKQRCLAGTPEWSDCECADDAGPELCFERTFRGNSTPVSLLFLVDRSGSMVAYWKEATTALERFFSDPNSAGLNVALELFPVETDECAESSYLKPDVPFGPLETAPDPQEAQLISVLAANQPLGGTPMFPAYSGAISVARERARTAAPQTVAVVLVTDGAPTGCDSLNSTGHIVDLAEAAATSGSPVRTFAVGLEGASRTLVELAAERGRGESFFISAGDVADDLTGTFEGIRNRLICEYVVETDSELAPEDVTVTLATGGGAPKPLPYDPDCKSGGWVLHGNPSSISLCPETCRIARNDDRAQISVAARCAKIDPGGTGGTGGKDGAGGAPPVLTVLGGACKNDSDCGRDLICLTSDGAAVEAGGPPGGLCTKPCERDSVCEALDADSSCEPLGEKKSLHYCVERCNPGPRGLSYFDTEKCHGRPEVACSALGKSAARSVCLPQCNTDSDCGDGSFCHPRDGLCRKTPAGGLPVGSACSASGDQCRGRCITLSGNPTCSEWCTDGAKNACGNSFTSKAEQLCLLIFTTIAARGGPGLGDQNACVELCDVDSDCESSGVGCVPFGFGQLAQRTGRKGMCGVATDIGISPPE